jgi:hypothetical protein
MKRNRPLEKRKRRPWENAAVFLAFCAAPMASDTALAQPEVIRCLTPDVPLTALPEAVLAEYRAEISAEFEVYFAEVSDYIACHDAERARVLAEAYAATAAYAAFLHIASVQKELP